MVVINDNDYILLKAGSKFTKHTTAFDIYISKDLTNPHLIECLPTGRLKRVAKFLERNKSYSAYMTNISLSDVDNFKSPVNRFGMISKQVAFIRLYLTAMGYDLTNKNVCYKDGNSKNLLPYNICINDIGKGAKTSNAKTETKFKGVYLYKHANEDKYNIYRVFIRLPDGTKFEKQYGTDYEKAVFNACYIYMTKTDQNHDLILSQFTDYDMYLRFMKYKEELDSRA